MAEVSVGRIIASRRRYCYTKRPAARGHGRNRPHERPERGPLSIQRSGTTVAPKCAQPMPPPLAAARRQCCNRRMLFSTYTLAGAHIAAELVNRPTLDATQLEELLTRHDVHEPVAGQAALEAVQAWSLRLRPVFEAVATRQACLVDALLVDAQCRPRLLAHDGLPHHLHYSPLDAPLPSRVKALTAAGLAHLIAGGGGDRLGCCAREACRTVFVDTSRNGRRSFCSVRCANAVNVSRHRARRRSAYEDDALGDVVQSYD